MAGLPNVIGSSTNPTLPFGRDALGEHFGMNVSAHGLKSDLSGDAAMTRDRIRAGTMGERSRRSASTRHGSGSLSAAARGCRRSVSWRRPR
ncbi:MULTISPECIES: hypothetical protein [Nonomuraea]|uniref:Uncharacterized protein n=1 Tax=Nonomuraea mangrovi TaxID=2316207 RepID=A0ABW4T1C1_9ACTN